jgi:murein DD-endopeptidase MepM/ murein hydrolase activator NlpD
MEKKQNRRKLLKQLSNSYRLLIINEHNLQEKTSISLTPFNFLLIGSAGLLLFSLLSWGIYTLFPDVKDYAPGSGQTFDGRMKNDVLKKISTLENELEMAQKREQAMKQLISGDDITAYNIPYKADAAKQESYPSNPETLGDQSAPDSRPMNNIGSSEREEQDVLGSDFLFFTPMTGKVDKAYSAQHPFVNITPQLDETIKATMDGTVVLNTWTPEFGYVIQVQHANNWVSVYKYNAAAYKTPGTFVKSGEIIGVTGYTDKSNPVKNLRFELWHNGIAVNPLNYIVF